MQKNFNTFVKTLLVSLTNGLRNSVPVRSGKLPLLKRIGGSLVSVYVTSSDTTNPKQAKANAGRLLGLVLFLFQLEDLFQYFNTLIVSLAQQRQEYFEKAKEENPEANEPIEPTIEKILGVESKYILTQVQSTLTGRTTAARDTLTISFMKSVGNQVQVVPLVAPSEVATFSKQILQLNLSQFQNLLKSVSPVTNKISIMRRVLGTTKSDELLRDFFRIAQ